MVRLTDSHARWRMIYDPQPEDRMVSIEVRGGWYCW